MSRLKKTKIINLFFVYLWVLKIEMPVLHRILQEVENGF